MTTQDKITRLQRWADGLRTVVDPKHFDMEVWINPNLALTNDYKECGSAACAAGWLPAIMPDHFKIEGELRGVYGAYVVLKNASSDPPWMNYSHVFVTTRHIATYFGLSEDQTRRIVYQDEYGNYRVTPQHVAHRIEEIIEEIQAQEQPS